MAVIADQEAISFIAEHGGRLYVYADKAGLKHVKTAPPDDVSLQFEEVEADGFLMYVEADIVQPQVWNVKFHHLPYHHVDVLWDGHQPGRAEGALKAPSNPALRGHSGTLAQSSDLYSGAVALDAHR